MAVWQEGGGSQGPVFRTHELGPRQLCPWHSEPQLGELGVGMHREPLCEGPAVGIEGKAELAVLSGEAWDLWMGWTSGLDLVWERGGGGQELSSVNLWENSSYTGRCVLAC